MKKLTTIVIFLSVVLLSVQAGTTQQKNTTTKKTTTSQKVVAKKPVNTTVKKDSIKNTEQKNHCIYITKADFIKKIANIDKDPNNWNYLGNKPCIIDFYTTWCGPCRTIAPVLEELAKEYEGKIYIYKVDAEKEKELARAFKVEAYPTLIFCPMKGNPQMAKGALPKAQLVEIINQLLLKKQVTPPPPFLQRR